TTYTSGGAPGIYKIEIQSPMVLSAPSSFVVIYEKDSLYVNPFSNSTKKIKPILKCVEQLRTPINGFSYKANFAYENANAAAIYIPIGADNAIIARGAYSGQQPELFLPGGGSFEILFDGNKLTWIVYSFEVNQKASAT
ncbi:hypothetical protein MD537_19375, partial [Flavihumibacter sediminis]|nr:hypothetical protein [Flavihumibacter sediminis]